MSVILRCQNCYMRNYYILDGRPICNNCGAGKFRFLSLFRNKKNQYKKNL